MGRPSRYSPEVRDRAVRMVFEHQGEYGSQWATIASIASKIGCTSETLRKWVRQTERDTGQRAGLTTDEKQRLKERERENRELKRANEILRRHRHFSRRRNSTAEASGDRVHRSESEPVRGRVDLQDAADCPVDVLRI